MSREEKIEKLKEIQRLIKIMMKSIKLKDSDIARSNYRQRNNCNY